MLIHSIIDSSVVNGPGNRMVVWTQGCTLNCRGCWNAATHPYESVNSFNEATVMTHLAFEGAKLEGITFSGGEPMQQAKHLLSLLEWIHARYPGLSIGMYTGYTEKELETGEYYMFQYFSPRQKTALWKKIKSRLDFAVMGRFNVDQRDISRPMCSSRNQKLVLFSKRYEESSFSPQAAEVIIKGSKVQITGFPTGDLV